LYQTDDMRFGPHRGRSRTLLANVAVIAVGLIASAAAGRAQSNATQDCLSAGPPDAVIVACTRLIESQQLKPAEAARVYLRRSAAERSKAQFDAALRDADTALRLDPKSLDAYMVRGTIYGIKKDFDAAIRDFDAVLRHDPNHVEARANRGAAYAQKHDVEAALRDFDAVVRLDPQSSAAYYQRGMAYRLAGRHDNAFHDFTTAVRLAPENAFALTDLAICYLDGLGIEKDRKRGAELLDKAAQKGFAPAREMLNRLNQTKP
jgi:tetratricopeptide (TPR) repeat protein